eukprot:GSMAST32.ASY1.ANO1.283.1 assembled CDS
METFSFEAIGKLESVFRDCRGTPRQGLLTPLTRSRLTLRRDIASYALEGLELYSHVWLFFVFHANTLSKTAIGNNKKRNSIKVKIRPPKHSSKVGVFATRSPHRPNPIGQTLAKIDKIEGSTIHLSGIDLIDGTPILDIKPYVTLYDSLDNACVAPWVQKAFDAPSIVVKKEKRKKNKKKSKKYFKFYNTVNEVKSVLNQILSQDIRSGGARTRRRNRGEYVDEVGDIFCITFDGVDVKSIIKTQCEFGIATTVEVKSIVPSIHTK